MSGGDLDLIADFGTTDEDDRDFARHVDRVCVQSIFVKPHGLTDGETLDSLSAHKKRRSSVLSSKLRNLRSGPIMDAGAVNENTVRAWMRNNALKLGERATETGNARYDLVDAASVTMMRFLTERLAIPAMQAAAMTNAARSILAVSSETEMQALDNVDQAPAVGRIVMVIDRVDGSSRPEFIQYDDLAKNDRRAPIIEVRIELREIVRTARDQLLGALDLTIDGLRHDFADAPDGRVKAARTLRRGQVNA